MTLVPSLPSTVFCRFVELSRALEAGKPPKSDKATILCDAVRVISQLRQEAVALKESNVQLKDQIKELKVHLPQFNCVISSIGFCAWDVSLERDHAVSPLRVKISVSCLLW